MTVVTAAAPVEVEVAAAASETMGVGDIAVGRFFFLGSTLDLLFIKVWSAVHFAKISLSRLLRFFGGPIINIFFFCNIGEARGQVLK